MSASEQQWQKLRSLEDRHQRVQSEHDAARRGLERLAPGDAAQLREAWRRYCEVIAELERTTSEFEVLRACTD
jgi:hypothetical protein